jgi:quercetin dioxygenase-like cupin family protein
MQTTDIKAFIINGEVAWEAAGDGIRRKILGYDDHLMLVLVEFEKGAVGHPHHHPHRQVSYVAAGSFEVDINGEKTVLTAGDSFFVEPDLVHGAVALEPGTLLDIFAPARQDFISNGK